MQMRCHFRWQHNFAFPLRPVILYGNISIWELLLNLIKINTILGYDVHHIQFAPNLCVIPLLTIQNVLTLTPSDTLNKQISFGLGQSVGQTTNTSVYTNKSRPRICFGFSRGRIATFDTLGFFFTHVWNFNITTIVLHNSFICDRTVHGVWKSQKTADSTLREKRATFTFWVDTS